MNISRLRDDHMNAKAISEHELKLIVGNVDETQAVEILKLQPTVGELEEAVVWATGDGDVLAKEGRPLTGKVSEIVEILTADEDEPARVR
jgi:hypothetical protein